MKNNIKPFSPQLLPNDKAGVSINWKDRIGNPTDWLLSHKYDGARVELFDDGTIKGRSLKALPNIHLEIMAEQFTANFKHDGIIEGEFFAPNMTFSELMHFFKTADVTSEKTVAKYTKLFEKTGGDPLKGWKYPGRSVEWLTTWHPELQFYVFDQIFIDGDNRSKYTRYKMLQELFKRTHSSTAQLIYQHEPTNIEEIYQVYDQSIKDGGEGLVLMRKDSIYKFGRLTLNQSQGFKIKDSNKDYTGTILEVLEGTIAREGAERTVNELGRSKTSQLKADRIPSGLAKGFKVRMDDGKELIVSLNGFNHTERRAILTDIGKLGLVGESIKFTGMAPVKFNGVPRHAHYTKGNIR